MRILGFSEKWDKLNRSEFTTFRFTRKDRDWRVGEVVQVVFKPRTKGREMLGVAEIIGKERRWVGWGVSRVGSLVWAVSHKEAVEDGFTGVLEMVNWMTKAHRDRNNREPMNKITLRWLERKE